MLTPNSKLNIIVGDNEAGKSTLLEAIALALTGRVNGRSASEEFNSHWFNTDFVNDFLLEHKKGERVSFPEISIELFFDNQPELQALCDVMDAPFFSRKQCHLFSDVLNCGRTSHEYDQSRWH
ncbi:hypothetical protein AB204_18995 [Xenorhabdus khoisanae]|uniref:Rad50/SbcC-type AAA domain-containing protein n=1 Tax=Xenorhabdus khoisanae TaxID=880157 RepID=A0A0J5FNA6_9GAMM|nr:hypothetical protein AB204_18995 [Xenorhabdus khoisanae]